MVTSGHSWERTYETPRMCNLCAKRQGEQNSHDPCCPGACDLRKRQMLNISINVSSLILISIMRE